MLYQRLFAAPVTSRRWPPHPISLADLARHEAERNPSPEAQALRDAPVGPLLEPAVGQSWLDRWLAELGADCAWGGYLEDRWDLWRGSYLNPPGVQTYPLPTGATPTSAAVRRFATALHLGVDYFVPAGSVVCLPRDGVLLATQYDDSPGGWGGRVVVRMRSDDRDLFVTFGHLERPWLVVGSERRAGEAIGIVGAPAANGGWLAHLHVQADRHFSLDEDGYRTGVWAEQGSRDLALLRERFPDPEAVL